MKRVEGIKKIEDSNSKKKKPKINNKPIINNKKENKPKDSLSKKKDKSKDIINNKEDNKSKDNINRQESIINSLQNNLKIDSNDNNLHKKQENARFNTIEKDINSRPRINNLIKINFNNNYLVNKIVLNTEKNNSKQKPQKNLIISFINDPNKNKNETIRRNPSQFNRKNFRITNRIINNNKIAILLNNNKVANENNLKNKKLNNAIK